jgi:uncharacterized protein
VTDDGIALHAVRVRSGAPHAPVVVFFTGNAGSPEGGIRFGETMARAGIDTVLAAYRGFSGAPGKPTESGLYLDGEAAVRAAGDKNDVILAGFSLGTGVAVELASRGYGKSVVLFGAFTSMVDVSRSVLKKPEVRDFKAKEMGLPDSLSKVVLAVGTGPAAWLAIADHYDSASKIDDVRIPVYLFHGTDDDIVPLEQAVTLSKLAPHAELFQIEGAGHFVAEDMTVQRFMARTFGTPL